MEHTHTKLEYIVFTAAFLVCTTLWADSLDHPTPENSDPVVVIDSQEVDLGNRSVIYNRIEPPTLAPQLAEESSPGSSPSNPSSSQPLPASETPYTFYQLSATVFDENTSEIRWGDGDHENVAWLNFNILHFEESPEIETPSLTYGFLITGTLLTRGDVVVTNAESENASDIQILPPTELPALAVAGPFALPSTPTSYSATRFLRALTDYYAAHGPELKSAYARRVAERQAAQDWAEAHPQPPHDTVINFFPILEEPSR